MNYSNNYTLIDSIFSTEECLQIFNELTYEIFEKHSDLLSSTTLMVHLFPPDVLEIKKREQTLDNKPEQHSTFQILEKIELDTGKLSKCRMELLKYNTTYEFYYFLHNDWKKIGDKIKNKLLSAGFKPVNEWVINYMTNNAAMGKHIDAIYPYVRYIFTIKQPLTESSVVIDDVDYFIPEGTTYLMNGEVPHSVLHNSAEPRIVMIGSIEV